MNYNITHGILQQKAEQQREIVSSFVLRTSRNCCQIKDLDNFGEPWRRTLRVLANASIEFVAQIRDGSPDRCPKEVAF